MSGSQVTSGANFETRGNFHYRSGLNAIPLLEWYQRHPDDLFLLEPALGAVAGQMNNIDEHGAPSMMMHMEPHILDFDPHSGDFGLGFFGCSLSSASYFVVRLKLESRPLTLIMKPNPCPTRRSTPSSDLSATCATCWINRSVSVCSFSNLPICTIDGYI